jgi:two-component system chemotaxis response regulator CheY
MAYNLEQASILVVEDMGPMLDLTKSILSIFGFKNVYGAKDANRGYELLKEYNPDIVITDWHMEPVDGLELIDRIRKGKDSPNPYVPIILMTGYSDRSRVENARDTGVTEFLMKPYTAKDLYSRIVQVIEKPRQFVDTDGFFGPDRRRRKNLDYQGPKRRTADVEEEAEQSEERRKVASEILNNLRERTSKI